MAKQAAEEERRRRRKPFENRKQALLESHPAGFELQTEAHRVRSISPYRRRGSRQTPLSTRWRVLSFFRSQVSSFHLALTSCGISALGASFVFFVIVIIIWFSFCSVHFRIGLAALSLGWLLLFGWYLRHSDIGFWLWIGSSWVCGLGLRSSYCTLSRSIFVHSTCLEEEVGCHFFVFVTGKECLGCSLLGESKSHKIIYRSHFFRSDLN